MKWGIAIVIIIIAGAAYYFWQQSYFEGKKQEQPAAQLKAEVNTPQEPTKYIPPSAVMEDGTI
ncbi:hypothetical protein A2765_01875 [Candidatus Kaiserbacteria bacterium RIFCSPHIGHO2_01_FULL_56_24]|uniref:Uncharacterized protein n=1 Tax=Candidatus Kaiserbacteria bacterium RIFCSPHIGHO2_01_FULL_56_24 TaxID=1798487 RepID=A0A1F6DHI0_9BACT|nr:MAG: hypothetical protein A2765_01875 [Candidatus Kaiserbacteria bacterium RIFCSPHIGHO2_01_FULL_56_24]